MKTCCNGDCNQGRTCPEREPVPNWTAFMGAVAGLLGMLTVALMAVALIAATAWTGWTAWPILSAVFR